MHTMIRVAALLLTVILVPASAIAASAGDAAFEKLAREFIEDHLRRNPENATTLGDHRFDSELSDYSGTAIAAEVEALRRFRADLARITPGTLAATNRIDAQIMAQEIEASLFNLTEEKPFEWNPLSYNRSLADGVYSLTAREFAPAEGRLRDAVRRLNAIPRVVEQIKANLKNPPRVHTETAILQTGGAISFVQTGFDELLAQAPELKAELAPAQAQATAALTGYKAWLEKEVSPRATGEFRLGAEKFRKKLRHTLGSDLSADEVLARAERELETASDQIFSTALPLHRRYFPNATEAERADRAKVVKAVLDRLAEKHATDDSVLERVKLITAAATDFVRQKDLISVPNTPLKIIVLPEFQRGVAIAYCDSPGALEPQGDTFYKVSPTPADWSPERKRSFFREYNDYMLHDLTVHEAMPGHYLQLAHSNRFKAPTLVRAIWWSGTFVEGWAVYTERVMADAGFGGPEVKMQQLKMRLRAIINAILDHQVHAGTMTEKEALDLMMQRGFQEEGEAVGKWRRVSQSSTQLSTYFVGAVEHDDLRAAAEKKEGAGFNLKRYHDRVLSFGSPGVRYVRQEMGL